MLLGKKGDIGRGVNYDGGVLVHFFPGNNIEKKSYAEGKMTAVEIYGQVGYGPGYVKYTHAVTDSSVAPKTKNTGDIEVGAATELPHDFSVAGSIGYKRIPSAAEADNFVYWKAGAAYIFQKAYGIVVGVDIVGNNLKHYGSGKNPGKTAPVGYVTKTFEF